MDMRTILATLFFMISGCNGPYDGPGFGKYHLGMTVGDTQALMSKVYPLNPYPLARLPGESKSELERGEYYGIYVEDEKVRLTFNWYKRLIKAQQFPPPDK